MKSSNRMLTIAVVLLLLINVLLVSMMLWKKNNSNFDRDKGNPTDFIAKELGLNDQQKADFKKLKDDHFTSIKPLFDSIRTLKKAMFDLMRNENVSDSSVTKISDLIAEQQAKIDIDAVKHFREVRAMFSGDQQIKYDSLIGKMMKRRWSSSNGWKGNDSIGKK
ncbi:MAG: periplasmic heavy metal sensor [Bacteroidetes bacterium]|nr:periplasmic heavy metal sensor [Bacteroidota bacterium]